VSAKLQSRQKRKIAASQKNNVIKKQAVPQVVVETLASAANAASTAQ
jgi:hypothetical protein